MNDFLGEAGEKNLKYDNVLEQEPDIITGREPQKEILRTQGEI